jgi:Undecaprenyl-phosphate glucose phosphotransferase
MLKAHSRLFEHLALALDLALIAGCWVVAYLLRFRLIGGTDVPPFRDYALQLLPILFVWGFLFHSFDLYRPSRLGSYAREWWDVAKACTLGVLVLVAVMTFAFRSYEYSRLVIGIFWVLSIVVVSFARAMFREALRFARRRGYNQRYAVVVGGGEPAAEVLRVLRRRPDTGIQIVGMLSDKREVPPGVTWLGGMDEIHRVLTTRSLDLVFIALPHAEYPRLTTVLGDIGDEPVTIHLVPDVFALRSLSPGVEEFDAVPFISLRDTSPRYGWNLLLKRAIDLGVGALALAMVAPLMAAIALAITLTSRGPVLYAQERMGLDGRRFRMLKFRTMRVDAEAATGPVWARPEDPRRTPIGSFLRRFSLDELPQLWNVLRGEMSLVGPRPERPTFVQSFRKQVPGYMLRHKVKGGITGWAQIHGWRGDTSIEERIKCDLYYIEHWSIGLDVQILLKTLWLGFRNRNAY